jgi:hypothetical protein
VYTGAAGDLELHHVSNLTEAEAMEVHQPARPRRDRAGVGQEAEHLHNLEKGGLAPPEQKADPHDWIS